MQLYNVSICFKTILNENKISDFVRCVLGTFLPDDCHRDLFWANCFCFIKNYCFIV